MGEVRGGHQTGSRGRRRASRASRLVAAAGLFGSLLTVATTTVVTHTALASSTTDLAGPPLNSGQFGSKTYVLANGNLVVTDPLFDSGAIADVGAVYLYNGLTHQLISTLTGSTTMDRVGTLVTEVGGSNFVVVSRNWINAGSANSGATTWVNGTTGIPGGTAVVSTANSLVGSNLQDGSNMNVVLLKNGNYVVIDTTWDGPGAVNAGSYTWGSGSSGVTGTISASNSLVGSTLNDGSSATVVPLAQGNYVVATPFWDNGGTADVGAVTWASGTSGIHGPIAIGTALYGPVASASVGSNGTKALGNGNFVVASPLWDNVGTMANVGAVTWGNGATGTNGPVVAGNSVIGVAATDEVGSSVVALTGAAGNFVVLSRLWDSPSVVDAGAATWLAGDHAPVGFLSPGNSLVGSQAFDFASSTVTALSNGNYVVGTPAWDGPGGVNVGAATFGGPSGISGPINGSTSLIGSSAGDFVGGSVTALATNGNYVVLSPSVKVGAITGAGASTWGSGTTGVAGPLSALNSLVGDHTSDNVGTSVTPLSNGAYVTGSYVWDSGVTPDTGAATFGASTGGPVGSITPANSLVGTQPSDYVSFGGTTALTNGNYVVSSQFWNNGSVASAGAATLGSGAGGTVGPVTPANSLVGSTASDFVGGGPTLAMPNGAYFVDSYAWQNGGASVGAATFGGLSGVTGPVTAANSVRGTQAGDIPITFTSFTPLPDGTGPRFMKDGSLPIGRPVKNIVTLFLTDATPPTLATRANVSVVVPAGTTSAMVTYSLPVATEDVGVATVACNPPSGSVFAYGTTTVNCTATNIEGLTATSSFTVTLSSDFFPLAPARLADTRTGQPTADGLFAGIGTLAAGSTLQLPVAGRGGVAADAGAVALNVTVADTGAPGFVTVFPCGSPQPMASNLNYAAGTTIPNGVISKIGAGGKVCFFTSQDTQLVVDVNGAFPPTSPYQAINPARVLDTRPGMTTIDGAQQATGAAAAGSVTTLHVAGRAGVPADAAAVVLNVTVTEPEASGYATVYPCGATPPKASNLNYTANLTIPNLVVAKVGDGGNVCIFVQTGTQLLADVSGYFPAGSSYAALTPARLLDTRPDQPTVDGLGAGGDTRPAKSVTSVQVTGRGGVPVGATTAVLNVTVTGASASGYVSVYPCGIDPPLASSLNFVADQTVPNAVIAKIGTDGKVCLYNSQATQLVTDVDGYFP